MSDGDGFRLLGWTFRPKARGARQWQDCYSFGTRYRCDAYYHLVLLPTLSSKETNQSKSEARSNFHLKSTFRRYGGTCRAKIVQLSRIDIERRQFLCWISRVSNNCARPYYVVLSKKDEPVQENSWAYTHVIASRPPSRQIEYQLQIYIKSLNRSLVVSHHIPNNAYVIHRLYIFNFVGPFIQNLNEI